MRVKLNLTSRSSLRPRKFRFRDWPRYSSSPVSFQPPLLSWLVWGKAEEEEQASRRELMVVGGPLRAQCRQDRNWTVPGESGWLATLLAQKALLWRPISKSAWLAGGLCQGVAGQVNSLTGMSHTSVGALPFSLMEKLFVV